MASVSRRQFLQGAGDPDATLVQADPAVWDALVTEGLVEIDGSPAERARLTLRGRCFVDDVLARL